jgi:hypothetical protein
MTSEKNGEKHTQTLGQQKKGELKKKGDQRREEKKRTTSPRRWVRNCNWGSYKWMASTQENLVVRWGVRDHSCPSSGFIYLLALRSDTLFISFFLSPQKCRLHFMKVLF